MAKYIPMLIFDTDSPEFRRVFECSTVWNMLKHTDEREFTVHWDIAEAMLRIADALHLKVHCKQLDDNWCEVIFSEE